MHATVFELVGPAIQGSLAQQTGGFDSQAHVVDLETHYVSETYRVSK